MSGKVLLYMYLFVLAVWVEVSIAKRIGLNTRRQELDNADTAQVARSNVGGVISSGGMTWNQDGVDWSLGGGCVAGWHEYSGRCYQLFTTENGMTAADGRRICRSNGGDMALIKSQEATDDMMELLKLVTNVNYAHIGLSDSMTEGTWQWLDGTPMIYSNWHEGEPNNSGDEDEAVIYLNSGYKTYGTWNDHGEHFYGELPVKGVFCEKRVNFEDLVGGERYGELSGRYLNYAPFSTPQVYDLYQCLQQCSYNNLCLSVNYIRTATTTTCQLLDVTRYNRGDLLESQDNWQHVEVIHTRVDDAWNMYDNTYRVY